MKTNDKLAAARPWFPEEDLPGVLEEIKEVLRGGRLILGPKTRALEEAWAKQVGTKHAVALSSCTAALEISFRYLTEPGKEVVVPTNTFVATANAALAARAKVVFADISADDYCIDAADVATRITDNTAVVVVVHISGFVPASLNALTDLCEKRGIAVVEDCAHAQGATYLGRQAGAFGVAGCFSLYPTKVITCGAGGVLTTDDDELAAYARSVRHHGQGASLEEIVHSGNDWLMDEVRAVLARSQLDRLGEFLTRRRAIALRYKTLLSTRSHLRPPTLAADMEPAFYKYPIGLPADVDRDRVRETLMEKHLVETGSLYDPPCHLMPVFQRVLGTKRGDFPIAERALGSQLSTLR